MARPTSYRDWKRELIESSKRSLAEARNLAKLKSFTSGHFEEGTGILSSLAYISRHVTDGNYTLDEVETSWAEINQLKRVPALLLATEWYGFLKRDFQTGDDESCRECIKFIRQYLKEGGATLADMGLSEKELIKYTPVPQL